MSVIVAVLVNGSRAETAGLALDRGLAYGDGLFETLAVVDGAPVLWPAHLARLQAGCVRLGIPVPDPLQLEEEATTLCHPHQRAVLKIIYTRGNGGRGYAPPALPTPTRILSVHPWPDYPRHYRCDGVRVYLCQTRLARQTGLAGIKHLNRLEQVLARREWDDPAIAEGLLCDDHGRVIEGVMSNLFVVAQGRVLTPDLSECGVAGIMRAYLLAQLQALGFTSVVAPLSQASLYGAEEILLCNSVIGIWPVAQIDRDGQRHTLSVGAVTRRLLAQVEDELRI